MPPSMHHEPFPYSLRRLFHVTNLRIVFSSMLKPHSRRPAAGQAALNALGQRGGKYFQTERSRPRNLRLFSINEYPADTVRLARENKSFASIHKSQHSRVT